ncbi:hypothetical protein [Azonexus sp.]|uniref:hypothetical protein n=1 Tax=Azonexus sp. TaxID=1872668 RepID=UPI0027BAD042|nr:hypothetical protein [Azonexus sp.]
MNKLFSIFCLSALLTAVPAIAHEMHGQAMHGGIVAEAGHAQFEIVSKDGGVSVIVTNHGAPVASAGASGKLTVLAGSSKSEIELKPAGENRLAGQGSLPAGAKLLISVTLPGKKPLQARAVVK